MDSWIFGLTQEVVKPIPSYLILFHSYLLPPLSYQLNSISCQSNTYDRLTRNKSLLI
jgi:hypothetical protein